jgi:hypothetical protein
VSSVSEDDLASHLIEIVEWGDRFAISWIAVDEELVLGRESGGALVVDLEGRLPTKPRAQPVALDVFERWEPAPGGGYERGEYKFELQSHELDYRRALHAHDADYFIREFQVATHEHCESTMGVVACSHYFGFPVGHAIDGMSRLYDIWLTGDKPDCSALRCLG